MQTNTEILNDLIRINNDRIEGYEKAAKETDERDADLRQLFHEFANDSRNYAQELKAHTVGKGPSPEKETTVSGEIYRVWMDVKATFSGKGRKAILSSCEYGEDAAQKAYEKALANEDLTGVPRDVVASQKAKLRQAHDQIKRMRDMQPA